MKKSKSGISRRHFLQSAAATTAAAVTIVPRHVLGKPPKEKAAEVPPSEMLGGALIGCGGRGGSTFGGLGPGVKMLARCDVKFKNSADDKTIYTDFRKVLERKDIDVVAIATHPGWHALISIAAMEAGKDVLCEKPMCRFIAEGRAIADAEKRYGRIWQVGTYGRFHADRKTRKIFESGLLKKCDTVLVMKGGVKVKEWSGKVKYAVQPVPATLDWDMYCGPAPLRPFQPHRFGGSHRGYWDYEGGGLSDMANHHLDGPCYAFGRDMSSPVEITPHAPPMHPECCMVWGWVEMKYGDGFTLVYESGEWGPLSGISTKNNSEAALRNMLSEEDRKKLDAMPDPAPLLSFREAVKARKPAGGNAAATYRVATVYHLMNVAMRCGRTIHFDSVRGEAVGDDEANRLINQPMRAPWRL
ncbi:MAG: Gfo/Idh/MocA family oxidoreductase [Thermoguttaceae bacterium]|jgi:predicted dehydrogenase